MSQTTMTKKKKSCAIQQNENNPHTMSTQLIRTIQSKLPAAALYQVCENAPEGEHPDGGTYRDHCHRCLDLARNDEAMGGDNREAQALCVAGVIGNYLQNEASPEEVAALEAAGADEAAGDDAVQLQACPDGSPGPFCE